MTKTLSKQRDLELLEVRMQKARVWLSNLCDVNDESGLSQTAKPVGIFMSLSVTGNVILQERAGVWRQMHANVP